MSTICFRSMTCEVYTLHLDSKTHGQVFRSMQKLREVIAMEGEKISF